LRGEKSKFIRGLSLKRYREFFLKGRGKGEKAGEKGEREKG
jgi:hypothetical protein